MVINTKALMDGIAVLSDDHHVRITVRSSAKGALITAGYCFVGGIFAGPVGMAIGGSLGGLHAYRSATQFRSIGTIIRDDMTDHQREQLCHHLRKVVEDVNAGDAVVLLTMVASSETLKATIMKEVLAFISNEMRMQIID